MKKILLFPFTLIVIADCLSQGLTKEDYLRKAKTQRTISVATGAPGVIMTTLGLASIISEVGGGFSNDTYRGKKETNWEAVTYTGCGLFLIATLFHLAANESEKSASSVTLKFENNSTHRFDVSTDKFFPALAIKFDLHP